MLYLNRQNQKKRRVFQWGSFLMVICWGALALAQPACLDSPPIPMLQDTVDVVLSGLEQEHKGSHLDRSTAYRVIRRDLMPRVDFDVMGRLVLTTQWKTLTVDQRSRFIREFSNQMTKTYGVLFEQYNGETIQFHCPIRELSNGSAHRVEVDSTVHHPNKPDNEVRFRLMEREGAWFVYDLIIDNISLVESYRQVFAESLSQKKSFEAFLSDLHRKNCTEKGVCA